MLVAASAGVASLALVGGVGVATAFKQHDVTLSVDGAAQSLSVREDTVGEVLEREGITLGEHDVVWPAADTRVSDGLGISVRHARPLTVDVDGSSRKVWTTARTVEEALGFLGLDEHDSKLSTSRSTAIGREGLRLEITTAKDVQLVVGGKPTDARLAGTVGDLLMSRGITPDADDIVTPAAQTNLTDGMRVTFVDVQAKPSTKDVKVPFEKTTKESEELLRGEEKLTTKGVDGLKRETYRDVYHDGRKVSSEKLSEKMVKKPVAQVTTVGTRKPEPAPVAAAPDTSDDPPATTGKRSGTKYDWMRAGGIPEGQWRYVDYIVSKESGWNPNAKNPSSGACGLVQAYPCSKLGPNWNDPVVALRWQYNYVNKRYGGYAGAYAFWKRNRWY